MCDKKATVLSENSSGQISSGFDLTTTSVSASINFSFHALLEAAMTNSVQDSMLDWKQKSTKVFHCLALNQTVNENMKVIVERSNFSQAGQGQGASWKNGLQSTFLKFSGA